MISENVCLQLIWLALLIGCLPLMTLLYWTHKTEPRVGLPIILAKLYNMLNALTPYNTCLFCNDVLIFSNKETVGRVGFFCVMNLLILALHSCWMCALWTGTLINFTAVCCFPYTCTVQMRLLMWCRDSAQLIMIHTNKCGNVRSSWTHPMNANLVSCRPCRVYKTHNAHYHTSTTI